MGVYWNLNFIRDCIENRQTKSQQNSFKMALEGQVKSFLLQFFQKMEFPTCFIYFPYHYYIEYSYTIQIPTKSHIESGLPVI